MFEGQPISGKFVELIQNRYTSQRIKMETAHEDSSSEKVLKPLKQEGILKGLPKAIRTFHEGVRQVDIELGYHGEHLKLKTTLTLILGGTEFFLTTAGITWGGVYQSGDWNSLAKMLERNEAK